MQKFYGQLAAIFFATPLLLAQGNSSQFDTSGFVFTTISGPMHNAVLYAPKPTYPPAALSQHISGRGVFKMDLDNGTPYDVRIVRSTGSKILDDAAIEALRKWLFLPHGMTWVTIPIEFHPTKQSLHRS